MEYYYSFKQYLTRLHHKKVWRIPLSTAYPCPNRIEGKTGCSFCDGKSFIAHYIREGANLKQQITKGITFFGKKFKTDLFYGYFQDNSSTYGPQNTLEQMYRQTLEHKQIAGIIISTRPDCITGEICSLISCLKSEYAKDIWIELGLQTTHDDTLQCINRNHTYDDFCIAAEMINSVGLHLGVHMILGLPGETPVMMEESIRRLVTDNQIDGIKFRLLDIIPGTSMADEYKARPQDFYHFTIKEYVNLICDLIEILPPDCVILRSFDYNPICNLFKKNEVQLFKDDLLREVRQEFDRRGTWQGSRY